MSIKDFRIIDKYVMLDVALLGLPSNGPPLQIETIIYRSKTEN